MPEKTSKRQAIKVDKSALAFEKYFYQTPGGISFHVNDIDVLKTISPEHRDINGFGYLIELSLYLLKVSCGQINRPQYQSNATLAKMLKISKRRFILLDQEWCQQGYFHKEGENGQSFYRIFGPKFDELRKVMTSEQTIHRLEETSDLTSERIIHPTGEQNVHPNPNEFNPDEFFKTTHTTESQRNTLAHSECQIQTGEVIMTENWEFLEEVSESIWVKLKNEHNIVSDQGLIRHYLALAQAANARERGFYERHIEEMVLYVRAQKNPSRDPALTMFNWLKFYKEPTKRQTQAKVRAKPALSDYVEPTKEEIDNW